MYKLLLTGHTGFIGSHVLRFFKDLGYPIESLSRDEWQDLELTYKKIGDCDVVIHCAWPREQDLQSHEHMRFALQTIEFYNMCKELGRRVINLGSSSEYGIKDLPMKEDMMCKPVNTYGLAKLTVTLHAQKLGFNTLRLFTVTGEGGHSFVDIYEAVEKWGNPHDMRDFVPVQIVCKAIERLIYLEYLYGEIINIGLGDSVPYYKIVSPNGLPVHNNSKWGKYPQRQVEPNLWCANISKMRKVLNL